MDMSTSASPVRGQRRAPSRPASQTRLRSQRSTNSIGGSARPAAAATAAAPSRDSEEEGKTAVKVAIRVRPPLVPSDPGFDLIPLRLRASPCDVTSSTSLSVQSSHGKKLFVFDKVFDEDVTQEGVWDYLSESVDSFVQGYNVSIMAYGQSGAGKSYTMGTAEEQIDPSLRGIVPRAATALFEKLAQSSAAPSGLRTPQRYSTHGLPTLQSLNKAAKVEQDWQLKATYVEIYNEQLRDLLVPESVAQAERQQVSIREDTKGRILLTGLTQVNVNSVDDLLGALTFGSSIRQTDATAINAKSSRSHAVFSLNLIRKKAGNQRSPQKVDKRFSTPVESLVDSDSVVTTDCKLHFVDLAGSERLKNTGAQGDRAKEGISINAGLASLGRVISQLSTRQAGGHVSYRDSRLTRLLQDSLGGNAITYMIACITPAEFHLSETLNTVQYAQRARAIQSKPEIQQTTDEEDKAARIERLQAEVAFLRDQVKLEKSDHRVAGVNDRSGRREAELHDQLMDLQESYNALSQRHSKVITEIGKARDSDHADTPILSETIGVQAVERLSRSSSFADAVEQVVTEYEKTIQNLETSLSSTRSNLSTSESVLMERESKIAHMESATHQLESRLRKMSERETTSDAYLRDLESQIAGATSSEEKSSTLIQSLRKELNRVKESETSSEGYISTLEDRLAEAEQDQAIMQREIERLEHVVERQRSIGRLDNLLADLDASRSPVIPSRHIKTNGHAPDIEDPFVEQAAAPASEAVHKKSTTSQSDYGDATPLVEKLNSLDTPRAVKSPTAAEQSKFVTDKLDTVSQELFDLRLEHDSTVSDYDELQRKYTIALQTLAKAQDMHTGESSRDVNGPATGGAGPFLADAGVNGLKKDGRPSSSRSSSELSSQQPSSALVEHGVPGNKSSTAAQLASSTMREEALTEELESLRRLHAENEASVSELSQENAMLRQRHQDTLSEVENLKAGGLRRQPSDAPSPSYRRPLVRRQVSADMLTGGSSDRAVRSFASLRNIGLDNFDSEPELRRKYDLHLNTVMSEMHTTSGRAQALEAEVISLRKDMETKSTMIAGLTRERASIKAASTVDFSIVGQMRDQLMESERQIRALHDTHATREHEFQSQIQDMRQQLDIAGQANTGAESAGGGKHDVTRLQHELSRWESRHNTAMGSIHASEAQLLQTIADLEASLRPADASAGDRNASVNVSPKGPPAANPTVGARKESMVSPRSGAAEFAPVDRLMSVDISPRTPRAEVPRLKSRKISRSVSPGRLMVDSNERDQSMQQELIADLETQILMHKTALEAHQRDTQVLKSAHEDEVYRLRTRLTAAEEGLHDKQAVLEDRHGNAMHKVEAELKDHRNEMMLLLGGAAAALGKKTDSSTLHSHIKEVVTAHRELDNKQTKSLRDLKSVQELLQAARAENGSLEDQVGKLKMLHEEANLNLDKAMEKERKSARLVQEMEDQLNGNFDQHEITNMHSEKQVRLDEATHARSEVEKDLEDHKLRVSVLESQLADLQRRSLASTARDSTPVGVFNRDSNIGSSAVYTGVFNRDSLSPEAAAIALARSSSASLRNSTMPSSPPPAIPLPALPTTPSSSSFPSSAHPDATRAVSPMPTSPPLSPLLGYAAASDTYGLHDATHAPNQQHVIDELSTRIRTVEKHLFAEKQLTATLEEALQDLETAANRTRGQLDSWRQKAALLEGELMGARREQQASRASLAAAESEREARMKAERARMALEERMRELNASNKKKKGIAALNCF